MLNGRPLICARLRQAGQAAYRSPHSSGNFTASLGRGTTDQRRGGEVTTCRRARGTRTDARFTSRTTSSCVALITRYHAPRRSPRFTPECRRAHRGSLGVAPILSPPLAQSAPPFWGLLVCRQVLR